MRRSATHRPPRRRAMTNERRIARLTREALGPGKRKTYSQLDDPVLRAVGIVILIVTVITFASWPREGESEPRRSAKSSAAQSREIVPAVARASDRGGNARTAEYTPIY